MAGDTMAHFASKKARAAVRNTILAPLLFGSTLHSQATPAPGQERQVELVSGVSITMVWIPAGEFLMGSPQGEYHRADNEGPAHRVTIRNGFWIGKYEVTQGQWEGVMGFKPNPGLGVGNNHPVNAVSWDDIGEFLHRTDGGFRLPSEAEWEYAARAGTQTRFYWGNDPGYTELDEYAVAFQADSLRGTEEVGAKHPNSWGLFDMSGNAWEWVEDDYHWNYRGAPNDGSAWTENPRATYRVLRGGSWLNLPWVCRSALRFWNTPDFRYYNLGFRLVWDP